MLRELQPGMQFVQLILYILPPVSQHNGLQVDTYVCKKDCNQEDFESFAHLTS